MDLSDKELWPNRDWDLSYMQQHFSDDFCDYSDLWKSNITDGELIQECQKMEKYSPIMEDISLDDDALYNAVQKIETE